MSSSVNQLGDEVCGGGRAAAGVGAGMGLAQGQLKWMASWRHVQRFMCSSKSKNYFNVDARKLKKKRNKNGELCTTMSYSLVEAQKLRGKKTVAQAEHLIIL